MATSTPPQGSKRPMGNASTPSHLNPASPTATRHQAGKTPVNHPTSGSTGSKTLGSTPMVQNLSQTGITSSPSTNMLGFNTPGAMAVDGTTPALNIPTPAIGGTQMIPTMSDLGLTNSSSKKNEDEERRAKIRKVLQTIGRPKGRVSEEGITRIGRRVGFQNDTDAEKLTAEELDRRAGNRLIQTAGNIVMIESDLKDNVPRRITVAFPQDLKAKEQEDSMATVLFDDLQGLNGNPLETKLDRFGMNLERLARIDRLSAKGGVNCFEALAGVHASLRRLYDQELLAVKTLLTNKIGNSDSRADAGVMCKKSGKPLLHARSRVGLELLYWTVDKNATEPKHADQDDTFALRIEVEASSAALFPSLRVSDAWLPSPLELADPDSGEGIPWQDPPPTFLASGADATAMAIDGDQKLPDLRFVATLDPPLVMPYQTAMNILSAVAAPAPPMLIMPPQYASILLDDPVLAEAQGPAAPFSKTAKQTVLSHRDGEETEVSHHYTLTSAKPDYGFKLGELPFSHPRQLVELLPTLRQWAGLSSLLQNLFQTGSPPGTSHSRTNGQSLNADQMMLDDFLTPTDKAWSETAATSISVALATLPVPTLSLAFPNLEDTQIASVAVQVLPNAEILVSHHEGIFSEAADVTASGQKLARALDVSADLGVWIEWMRTKICVTE